jgi:uncharacterized protein YukE
MTGPGSGAGVDFEAAEAALNQMTAVAEQYRAALAQNKTAVDGLQHNIDPVPADVPFAESTRQTVHDSFFDKNRQIIESDGAANADLLTQHIDNLRRVLQNARALDQDGAARIKKS